MVIVETHIREENVAYFRGSQILELEEGGVDIRSRLSNYSNYSYLFRLCSRPGVNRLNHSEHLFELHSTSMMRRSSHS